MIRVFVAVSLLIGTVARVLPLLDPFGRALRQFPSEDGYLMLTISRNLALGNGLSVEDGMTLTNGTQPLSAGVYAFLFWLVGGDKVAGVVLAQIVGILMGLVGAFLIYRVGRALLPREQHGAALALVAAAAWYASTQGTRFTQNCLETGPAALSPMLIALFFLRHDLGFDRPWPLKRCAQLGALLALAFWIRNDAVLLSAAVCGTLVFTGLRRGPVTFGRRILEAGCVGTCALILVSPWLGFGYVAFGHIVPVSGIAQGARTLGENLAHIPVVIAEQASIVLLIPSTWETLPVVVGATLVLVLLWIPFTYHYTSEIRGLPRDWLTVLSVWAVLHVAFYGLAYGAGYFVSRYLFPLSVWFALLSVWLAYKLWVQAGGLRPALSLGAALFFMFSASVGLDVRAYLRGTNNGHFQVVEWVSDNVPDDAWVAAIQTGTLGFFHDRTYNLDGKVSPPALKARFEGRTFEYIRARPIMYLVDWIGIASWLEDPRLGDYFELVLLDEERNLAALRRLEPVAQ